MLPGFSLTLGVTLAWLGALVLLPLCLLVVRAASAGPARLWSTVTSARVLAAFRLSLGASLAAALINAVVGLLIAWTLARYRFPGKRLLDALVDLPFALPTAVAGVALTTLYVPTGWMGQLLGAMGLGELPIAFARPGVVMALTFVGLPFVVRTVEPVLLDLDPTLEEAAAVLGASRWTTFRRVLLPAIFPSLLTGFALAFARALGEYGSIVFISGNMPLRTEIVPLLIVTRLEQYDYLGASVIATVMLAVSFALLLCINLLQARSRVGHTATGGR